MQEDLVFRVPSIPLAYVIERAAECLDRRFQRGFDLTPLQAQAVDVPLDVVEAQLSLLDQQIRTNFSLSDDAFGLLLRVLSEFVGEPLGRQQRIAQVALMLPVLAERGLHPREILPEPVGLAQCLLVVVGHGCQERCNFNLVETAQRGAEALLAQINRADIHVFASKFLKTTPGGRQAQHLSRGGGLLRVFRLEEGFSVALHIGTSRFTRQSRVKHWLALQKWRFPRGPVSPPLRPPLRNRGSYPSTSRSASLRRRRERADRPGQT